MKKVFLLLLVGASMMMANAQTADEVINKHIDAIGGKEKLLTLQTVVCEGAISIQGMDLPISFSVEQSKGFRMDINVMGTKGYQIYTPIAGWSYMPFQGNSSVDELPADLVKEGRDKLDIQGDLLNYAAKGHKVELQGKEKMDDAECFKLKLTSANGLVKILYIDVTTYYINKIVATSSAGGESKTSEVTYSNYKKTPEGFVFAYTMKRPDGDVNFEKIP